MDGEEAGRGTQGDGYADLTNSSNRTWSSVVAFTVSAPSPSPSLVSIHTRLMSALILSHEPPAEV